LNLLPNKTERISNGFHSPTPKDDALIGRLYKIVEIAALNIGKAKEPGVKLKPLDAGVKFVKRSD
jgi:hypothetical protein